MLAVVQKCFFIKLPLSPSPSLSHHLVARVYESKAEFRSALQHEKEGYTIYKNQVMSVHAANLCRITFLPETSSTTAKQCHNLELREAFLTNSSEQMPGNLLSRDGAELLLCTIIDQILCQKSLNSLPASLFLLYPCCWTETSVGGMAPRSGRALKELTCSFHFFTPPVF